MHDVVPMDQLLRLGRRWQACGGTLYMVPPRRQWGDIVPALRLFADVERAGLLDGARVVSGYRPLAYNRCEGGSDGSRHRRNAALDIELRPATAERMDRLCAHWRSIGPARGWGLGFYTPTRIHLDATGFRTWGADHHRGTSLCASR